MSTSNEAIVDNQQEFNGFFVEGIQKGLQIDDLPNSPKKVAQWLSQNDGWLVEINSSTTWHDDVLYAADAKKKPGEENPSHRKGDVWIPGGRKVNWFLGAMRVYEETPAVRVVGWWITKDGKTSMESILIQVLNAQLDDALRKIADAKEESYSPSAVYFDWEPAKRLLRAVAPVGAPSIRLSKAERTEQEREEAMKNGIWIG